MNLIRLAVGLTIAMSIALFPAVAAAQTLAPPGNSAINQYRETLPAPGGDQLTNSDSDRSPVMVLGAKNARRIEALGAKGRAAAALAAATAPDSAGSGGGRQIGTGSRAQEPSGSSGLEQVLGQVTGSSSGEMGLLLPLIVIATILGAVTYVFVRRRTASG